MAAAHPQFIIKVRNTFPYRLVETELNRVHRPLVEAVPKRTEFRLTEIGIQLIVLRLAIIHGQRNLRIAIHRVN